MTAPTMEAERAAFEAWFVENKFGGMKDSMWAAWEARALAATPVAEGVALPPLPEPDTHDAAGYRRAHSAEQVRQAQRDAYELGKRASIDGQLTGAPSPVKQSIDTPEFAVLVSNYLNCRCNYSDLVAYIDGRTAGTAPEVAREGWHKAELEWRDYPEGTKARESWAGGGFWLKTDRGWKWHLGATFPTPGSADEVLLAAAPSPLPQRRKHD